MESLNKTCKYCKNIFLRSFKDEYSHQRKGRKNNYCSIRCVGLDQRKRQNCNCSQCGKNIERVLSTIKKNTFCSQSCSAKYNNTHKTHGTRRSKLEKWLEEKLKSLYPTLEIHFNRKDAINSELDIYFPILKLAFELNGIYHYEPIHGPEKLASVQNNDQRKFQACLEKGIELCIIDSSKFGNFKESKAKEFLDIIISVIEQNL